MFVLDVACTYHWGSVYRNTNLLQIHFPNAMYISITFLSIHSLLENFPDVKFFSLILAEKPFVFFPDFPDWKKFSKFSLISGNPEYS